MASALALLFRFSGRRIAITSSLLFGSVSQSVARIIARVKRTSTSRFVGPLAPRRAESPRVVLDVVFGFGEDFETALVNLVVGKAHHGARRLAAAHSVGSRGGVAEGFERVVFVQLQTVLFENVDADDGVAGGGRVHGKDFPFEIGVVIDPWGHDQLLVDAAASSQEDYEVIFLGIFSLPFGPGDDVIGVVEDDVRICR